MSKNLVVLLHRSPGWVHRRVETVELVSDKVVSRRLSVDFTLPKAIPTRLWTPADEPVYFVPLTLLRRRPGPMRFDLRDESGASVPLLTEREHARLTVAALYYLAQRIVRQRTDDRRLDVGLRRMLAYIPLLTYGDALGPVRAILNPDSQEWNELTSSLDARNALRNNEIFRNFLSLVADNSLTVVPVVGEPGQRRIFKLCYEEELFPEPVPRLSVARQLTDLAGWTPMTVGLEAPIVGAAETHHMQVVAPPNLELTGAGLWAVKPESFIRDLVFPETESPSSTGRRIVDALNPMMHWRRFQQRFFHGPHIAPAVGGDGYAVHKRGFRPRAHLYIQDAHNLTTGGAWIGLRAERKGLLALGSATSFLVLLVLVGAWRKADALVNQPTIATSLLVLAPGLISVYLVRAGEHPLARRLLRFPRVLVTVSAGLAFAAAAALVAWGPTEARPLETTARIGTNSMSAVTHQRRLVASSGLEWTLFGLMAAAAVVLLLLLISLRWPRPQGSDA